MRYCRCKPPSPETVEGIQVCATCGDQVPDRLTLLMLKWLAKIDSQQREIAQQQREILTWVEGQEESEEHQPDAGLLEPAELAKRLGKDRKWVYEHSEKLGAIRLGDGPKPRLYFDLALARERLAALAETNGAAQSTLRPSKRRR